MSASGPLFPTTGIAVSSGSGPLWTNPQNIYANDGSFATLTSNGTSRELRGLSFNFSIPTGATIDGITLNIVRRINNTAGNTQDLVVGLVKTTGGAVVGDNKASGTTWPLVMGTGIYGGSSDLWNTSWTPAEINSTGFGVALRLTRSASKGSVTAEVDSMMITVNYTTLTTSTPIFNNYIINSF